MSDILKQYAAQEAKKAAKEAAREATEKVEKKYHQEKIEIVCKLLAAGKCTEEEIADITNLTRQEIEDIRKGIAS